MMAIRPDTILISIMYANNEIGTLQPVHKIGQIAQKNSIPFHTDAVQAYGHLPIQVDDDSIDFLSVSAHKFGGPKGVGFLYANKELALTPLLYGGAQEAGRRAAPKMLPASSAWELPLTFPRHTKRNIPCYNRNSETT